EYSEPHWSEKHCAAMAYEKTTLFGLTINSRKLVPYGSIDPEWSREQFIREGLVKCEIRASAPFLDHNRRLRADAEKLLAKTRRTDLVVDDFAIYGFYSQRLPADIYDAPRLNRWRKEAEQQNPRVLFMELTDMTAAVAPPKLEEYPDQCQLDRVKLPLEYRFEPGAEDDGVTIVVPQAALGQVTAERLGWLVPGLLEQKVTAIIRALPKAQRRNLVPVPDTAAKVVAKLRFGEGRFLDCVAKLLTELAGEPITPLMLDQLELPPHLKMNVRVIDDQGQAVRTGRDVDRLRKDLQDEMRAALKAAALAGGLLAGGIQGGGIQGGGATGGAQGGGAQSGRGGAKSGSERTSGGGVAATTASTGGLTIGRPAPGRSGASAHSAAGANATKSSGTTANTTGANAAGGAARGASGQSQVSAGATSKSGAKGGASAAGGKPPMLGADDPLFTLGEPEVQHPWHRDKLVQWNFGDLPEKFELRRGGVLLTLFPALVDQGVTGAGLRLADSREQADDWTRAGTRRLFAIAEHRDLKMQVEWFPDLKQLTLCAAGLYSAAELRSDIEALIADRAFVGELPLVRSADEFQWRLKKGRASIELAVQDAVKVVGPVLKSYHGVRLLLDTARKIAPYAVDDVNAQTADLLVKNFLTVVPWRWLQHFPRYVEAQRQRLLKATQGGLTRDRQMHAQLTPLVARYRQRRQENEQRGRFDPELEAYRWLLEELRVSMFAQQLGTSTPVSIKRLDQQWQKVS
ncbi:MAG TPA: DUF3418 domain-containing protein, partial [Pirellulaceae bacterium]|nr:DUF3418 domain-containing protein [Pirellulaceae bacterium]